MKTQYRPKFRTRTLAVLGGMLILAATILPSAAAPDDNQDEGGGGPIQHIFYIMMENHATSQIIGNTADAPFINQLAHRYGLATNYHGVTHPSLPNYLSAISGDFQGIWDDCKAGSSVTCPPEEFVPGVGDATDPGFSQYSTPGSPLFGLVPPQLTPAEITSTSNTPHWFAGYTLVDQLENKGLTWKAYMQSLPVVGSDVEFWPVVGGSTYKLYAQKHNPFMYFSRIRNAPSRVNNIVPLPQLDYDLATNIPSFVWISPDQCNDMHGVSPSNAAALGFPTCGYPNSGLDQGAIRLGDVFLQETVGKIMNSSAWKKNSIILIVWDEDDYGGYPTGCCGSPTGKPGTLGATLGGALTPAIVIRSNDPAHRQSNHPYNHYSLLGTIQRVWNLGCLAKTCSFGDSDLMLDLFGE
jgi:hypothetical protein